MSNRELTTMSTLEWGVLHILSAMIANPEYKEHDYNQLVTNAVALAEKALITVNDKQNSKGEK